MNEQCIQVNNLTKSFSGRKVINDISFEVNNLKSRHFIPRIMLGQEFP